MGPWLRFFRVVNLPTVPGDVLVGAAAVVWGSSGSNASALCVDMASIAAACLSAVLFYMFGLADNDIVGAAKDGPERPIPAGAISLRAARLARGLCLFVAMIVGALAHLPPFWWIVAFALAVVAVVYNRTKQSLAMGLCRGLNVVCGGVVPMVGAWRGVPAAGRTALFCTAAAWTAYIMLVTKYSEGEETDPARRRMVGLLIGALVYLQLGALLFFYLQSPCPALRNSLLAGAGLLIALRLTKRTFPKVSAS